MSASSSAQAMPSSIEPVVFITTTSGMATAPTSEPIETSISPAITTMPTPMPAIIASDAWPSTLVMLRVVRNVGDATAKNAMRTSRQSSSTASLRRNSARA